MVALARGGFKFLAIHDCDAASVILDQAGLLERPRDHRHGGPPSHAGFLAQAITVHTPLTRAIAVLLTGAGAAFAVWARLQLGRNWSGAATIKHDHELIAVGPYRLVRHPIYAGGIVAAFGTALAAGDVGSFLDTALVTIAWLLKIRVEEAMLVGAFGDRYVECARDVPTLIPFLL